MKNHLTSSLRSLGAIVFVIILAPLATFAQSGTWTTASSTGFIGGYGLASAEIGGKIYVMGGSTSATSFSGLQVFDPSTNIWSTPTTTGTFTPRDRLTATVVNGNIYTIGGWAGAEMLNTLEVFDPVTNIWSSPTTTGTFTARRAAAAVVANGKIYVMGGFDGTKVLNTFEVFDPATNVWSTPVTTGTFTARKNLCAGVVNGKIYVIGGYNDVPMGLNTLEVFDPSTNSWSTPVTTGTFTALSGSAVVLDSKIYVFGTDGVGAVNLFNIFDPATNTWSTPSTTGTFKGSNGPAASIVGGNMYVMGGANASGFNSNAVFTPAASGVRNNNFQTDILISPNPTNGIATVSNVTENLTNITVMNVLGEKMIELANPLSSKFSLDLSNYPSGIYYAKFISGGSVVVRKIVKE
ncbi:MAG: kelch repeat-containing protein [Ignavibacteriota bacterium]